MKRNKMLIAGLLAALLSLPFQAYAHGGGCRKDSPPGKCCHMDKKAGTVHCH